MAHPDTDWAPASSFTVWFAPFTNDGTSFTGFTVMETVAGDDVSEPSFVVNVKLSLPKALAFGV